MLEKGGAASSFPIGQHLENPSILLVENDTMHLLSSLLVSVIEIESGSFAKVD